jgi:hypothetical protein
MRSFAVGLVLSTVLLLPSVAHAQDPPCELPARLDNHVGLAQVVCPCFVNGERAGAVFDPPADHYPLEVLKVGVGWGSQVGGAPATLETAIQLYAGGLPNPGVPFFEFLGPQLIDGFLNEYDLSTQPGERVVNEGPFTVTLEFLNDNAGDIFAPSMTHDGAGCAPGRNVVYSAGWYDACSLQVSGNWVIYVVYRSLCGTGTPEERLLTSSTAILLAPWPNPATSGTSIAFFLPAAGPARLEVYNVRGERVAVLGDRDFPAGPSSMEWDRRGEDGRRLPSGMYFVQLTTARESRTQKVLLLE